jgi:hypothetical protein
MVGSGAWFQTLVERMAVFLLHRSGLGVLVIGVAWKMSLCSYLAASLVEVGEVGVSSPKLSVAPGLSIERGYLAWCPSIAVEAQTFSTD